MKVHPDFCQGFLTLHGGAVCTIIDLATSILLSFAQDKYIAHVTLSLSSKMMSGIKAGEDAYILSKVDRIGNKVAFLSCQIFNEKGELCYSGTHVKSFLKSYDVKKMSPKL